MSNSSIITISIITVFAVSVVAFGFFGNSIYSLFTGASTQTVSSNLFHTSQLTKEVPSVSATGKIFPFHSPFRLVPSTSKLSIADFNALTKIPVQNADKINVAYYREVTGAGIPYQSFGKEAMLITNAVIGNGKTAKFGDRVSILYTGMYYRGSSSGGYFDTAHDNNNNPLQFTIGSGKVIPGLEEGVIGMKVGGRRTLNIPPTLGYGSHAVGPIATTTLQYDSNNNVIPSNSRLLFGIKLVGITTPIK